MSLIELQGDRAAVGFAHGQALDDRIHDSLAVYERLFADFVGLSWSQARSQATRFLPAIERHFPDILDELQGIAKGANLDFEDILALNCRSEIALTQSGGCSALSLWHEETQWLAQNWDWRADQQRNVAILRITMDGQAPLISVGEAGMVGKIGLNVHGIGVCLNAIRSQTCGDGLPIHIALRKILECRDFAAAQHILREERIASPAHFLVASQDGQAIGFEVHPGTPGEIAPRNGTVLHTNHLIDPMTTGEIADFPRPDSPLRLSRLETLMERLNATTPGAFFEVLSDHDNAPSSICRHINLEVPEAERMETLFSVVMNLNQRRLYLRMGKPCESDGMETFSLEI
ncbi:peptidase C45 acyl-coenzyme A--6- aminopenicillanic acid acyl-transferase [Pistricoccus aurantiacus]|uniref:Peptidase C45 acyl-coenzyme A--6-aminopenicillanic acid acyl-transferase n=1 Tax=Pistricoccus aurantiacus TaxID=1883414 RepID=A0A5B8SPI5_9GAMM|nr:C45 family peptidase [Pistricoccus aurantiacus]QEA38114.1 peptidase C45 acyl-coenzyme A--6- aminopenicillanic acid acyl-transferase [Pistricoccus aurantiacus]